MIGTLIRALPAVFLTSVLAAAVIVGLPWLPREPIETAPASAGQDTAGRVLHWYKGNTHTHARITLGDYSHGDTDRNEVARWYHDHGYHFVSITDHNRHTDASTVSLPADSRPDFLLVSGMEVTSDHRYPGVIQEGERKIHSTAFGTREPVDWRYDDHAKSAILSLQAERIGAAGGVQVVSHPNYRFQLVPGDVTESSGVRLIEIANVHPRSNHAGHPGFRPGTEEFWDRVLTGGKLVYGVAADDAHDFAWFRQALRNYGYAPPGGAWIMVRAPELTVAALSEALLRGDFYGSTGVHLADVTVRDGFYRVTLDREQTLREVRHRWIRDAAPVVDSDDSHFVIEFIGSHGRILHAVHDHDSAELKLEPEHVYVRARIAYLELLPDWLDRNRARAYYAWTQPVMTAAVRSAE